MAYHAKRTSSLTPRHDPGNGDGSTYTALAVGSSRDGQELAQSRSFKSGNIELRYLFTEEHQAWDALVDLSPQGSVLCRSWWLNAVSPDIRVLGYFESGRLVAGIPLYFETRMGLRICCMPKLVHTWGVVMEPMAGKTEAITSRENHILRAFAEYLARQSFFMQLFHPACDNWLPFYWNGFSQTTHYTYVIDELQPLERVWEGLDRRLRAQIRKAKRNGLTVRHCSADVVFDMSLKTFQRQGMHHPLSRAYFQKLCDTAEQHSAGVCFAVEDTEGRVHGASSFLWDHKRGYGLVSGQDPSLRASDAGPLMIWHTIEFAASRTAVFDFEGSMKQSIEQFFRPFGAKRTPYYRITKLPRWTRAALCLAGKYQL